MTRKIGDTIGFKSDIEQYGIIVGINTNGWGDVEYEVKPAGDHFEGEYLSRTQQTTDVRADRCW